MSGSSDHPASEGATREPADSSGSDADQVARDEHDVDAIRDNLGRLLGELGERRRDWPPLRLLRRIPRSALFVGLGALGVGAGVGVWQWRARSGRQRDSWFTRAKQLSLAARRAIDAPEDVARTAPSVPKKVAAAVAVAAAGFLTRRFLSRYLARDGR